MRTVKFGSELLGTSLEFQKRFLVLGLVEMFISSRLTENEFTEFFFFFSCPLKNLFLVFVNN